MIRTTKTSVLAPVQEVRSKPSKRRNSLLRRTCAHDNCTTFLSAYNLTFYCSVHEGVHAKSKDFI